MNCCRMSDWDLIPVGGINVFTCGPPLESTQSTIHPHVVLGLMHGALPSHLLYAFMA